MSEGTKLGEFNDNQEFKSSIDENAGGSEALKGTKIGQVSEFEESLLENKSDETTEEVVETKSDEVKDEKVEEKTEDKKEDVEDQAVVAETVEVEEAVEEKNEAKQEESQDDLLFKSVFEQELDRLDIDIEEGDIVEGTVRSVEKSGVLVDIGFKSDGFISNEEFSNDPAVSPKNVVQPGDKISACVEKLETKQGYTKLSRKKAEFEIGWNDIIDLSRSKDVIEVIIASKVQGGLVSEFKGIKGFIPASQVIKEADQELDTFIRQRLNVVVLKADRSRRKVIFSHKMAVNKRSKADIDKIIEQLDIGQVVTGRVSSIKDFGVFVDIGGIEGLVHISELSWSRINHPKDMISQGQEVKVFILGVDKENRRISLGMKQLEPDPWVKAQEKYQIGQVVKGTVSRCAPFGAFVILEDHLEGLIHISELSEQHVQAVTDVVNPGDEISATIIKVVPDEQKIGLSLKLKGNSEETAPEGTTSEETAPEGTTSEEAATEETTSEEAATVESESEASQVV